MKEVVNKKQLINNRLKYEGLVSKTNEGYRTEIIEYKGYYHCTIKLYLDGDVKNYLLFEKPLKIFKNGQIKNPYHKSVFAIGYIGEGVYKPSIDSKDTKEYSVWNGMLRRCYSQNLKDMTNAYKDVRVCEKWHNFQNFARWYEENYNPKTMEGWQLDKDIICKDCKTYSPENCAFVPRDINSIAKGVGEICIREKGNRYLAYISKDNKHFHIGSFKTKSEAFEAYKVEKVKYISSKLLIYEGTIDKRIVCSLTELQYLRIAEKSSEKSEFDKMFI